MLIIIITRLKVVHFLWPLKQTVKNVLIPINNNVYLVRVLSYCDPLFKYSTNHWYHDLQPSRYSYVP